MVLGVGLRYFQSWAQAITTVMVGILWASVLLLPWEAWLLAAVQFAAGAYVFASSPESVGGLWAEY